MSRPGESADETYPQARRALLDALDALGPQRSATILVGAQAVYLHTGMAEIPVPPFTKDADLAIDPIALVSAPRFADAMEAHKFKLDKREVGRWRNEKGVIVDLLVPESAGGAGRRGARLGVHGTRTARKVRGLEGALVDLETMVVDVLEPGDARSFEVRVAGPAALLVAKAHKMWERAGTSRASEKDAHDALRLLQVFQTADLVARFRKLAGSESAAPITAEAVGYLEQLFLVPRAPGPDWLRAYVGVLDDPEFVVGAANDLLNDLLMALRGHGR